MRSICFWMLFGFAVFLGLMAAPNRGPVEMRHGGSVWINN